MPSGSALVFVPFFAFFDAANLDPEMDVDPAMDALECHDKLLQIKQIDVRVLVGKHPI